MLSRDHISQIEKCGEPQIKEIRLYNHNPIEQAETLLRGYVKREGIKLKRVCRMKHTTRRA